MIEYGRLDCDHHWHLTFLTNSMGDPPIVCSLCGALAFASDVPCSFLDYYRLSPGANLNGLWVNPYIQGILVCNDGQ